MRKPEKGYSTKYWLNKKIASSKNFPIWLGNKKWCSSQKILSLYWISFTFVLCICIEICKLHTLLIHIHVDPQPMIKPALLKLFVTESCTERFLWLRIWGGGAEARWPNALRQGASHVATVWMLTIKAYD